MGQAIKTLLVVEDEPLIRDDLIDFFEDRGYRVLAAPNADQAIDILAACREVFAVLTDIQMPGSMDGLRLAHYVRDRYPPTLLLVASGAIRPTPQELPSGAFFFPKPFNPRSILEQLCAAGGC